MVAFRSWWMILLGVLLTTPAWAGTVDLRISARDLQVGQVAQVQVILTNQRPDSEPRVLVPRSGLNIQFMGQSSQVNTINGRTTRLYAYNYRLEALAEGQFQVGPATVRVGGQTIQSRTVALKVSKRAQVSSDLLEAHGAWEPEEAWVGQIVMYKRSLRSRRRIGQDNWTEMPQDGVAFLNDGPPQYGEYRISDPDGDIAVKEESHPRIAKIPGSYESSPGIVRVEVVVGQVGQGVFARYKTQQEVLTIPKSKLTIKSLPPAPPGFSGLVGEFTVQSSLEMAKATVGASIPWVIEIEGQGSLESFDWSIDKDQDGARVYDGTPSIQSGVVDGVFVSRARFEQVIVPTKAGTLKLPTAQIITFSPKKGEYVTHDVAIEPIVVEQGASQDGALTSFVGQLTRPQDFVQEPTYEGVRAPYERGAANRWVWGGWMPWMALVFSAPVLIWLLWRAGLWLREWWARRMAARVPREVPVRVQLKNLVETGDARWAALEGMLGHCFQRAAGQLSDEERLSVLECLGLIHGVRFGGKQPSADLEGRVTTWINQLDDRRKEAS